MPPSTPIESRFWSKVDASGGPDACWLWMGGRHKWGYGMFNVGVKHGGRITTSYRVAYILHHGLSITDSAVYVCHNCPDGDNPQCCNPRHLFLGNVEINNRDRSNKGRNWDNHGEKNPRAKLTEKQVREIRGRFVPNKYGTRRLSREYGVSRKTISLIVFGEIWRHIL